MATRKEQTPTLPILDAIDSLANQLRKMFPEIPQCTIVLGSSGKSKKGMKLGHFAASTWHDENTKHEILISGEALSRGAERVLATLIHESAHAVAHVHKVQDTSNNGRYHNKRFKLIAEGLGLEFTAQIPTIGWSDGKITDATKQAFSAGLKRLEATLTTYRLAPANSSQTPVQPIARNKTKLYIDCECASPVTVSKIWFESAVLFCGNCQTQFKAVTEEES
jgi:hypothetical protein